MSRYEGNTPPLGDARPSTKLEICLKLQKSNEDAINGAIETLVDIITMLEGRSVRPDDETITAPPCPDGVLPRLLVRLEEEGKAIKELQANLDRLSALL